MLTTVVIVLAVVIVVVAVAAAWLATNARRRRLRQRFGPEYDRLVAERGSRKAAAELTQRQRHVRQLDLHPLTPEVRARYTAQWALIQEQFVETPHEALKAATGLVTAAMRERGYPTDNYDQILADLSVEHAHTLNQFREAHDVGVRAGAASTEDLRQAMIRYRTLFHELVGADGAATGRLSRTRPGDIRVAGNSHRDVHGGSHSDAHSDAHSAVARDGDVPGDVPGDGDAPGDGDGAVIRAADPRANELGAPPAASGR